MMKEVVVGRRALPGRCSPMFAESYRDILVLSSVLPATLRYIAGDGQAGPLTLSRFTRSMVVGLTSDLVGITNALEEE